MTAIRRAFADLSIGQLHYASCGDEAAPVVLLLHQTPRSWLEYRDVLPLLGVRHRAIAMDTPGFGDSAPLREPVSIEGWAAVAIELLDASCRHCATPRPADGSHLAALWQRRQGFYPPARPDLLEAFVRDALKVSGDVEGGHRAVGAYRMEDHIGGVRQPTLLIRATEDPFAAPHVRELRAHLPQARVADIEGGWVPLPDQLPQAFAAAVLAFLDGQR